MNHTPTSIRRAATDLAKKPAAHHVDLGALAVKSLPDAVLDAPSGVTTRGYEETFALAWVACTLARSSTAEGDWPTVNEELLAALGRAGVGASLSARRAIAESINTRATALWGEACVSYQVEVERLHGVAAARAEAAKPLDSARARRLSAMVEDWAPDLARLGAGGPALANGMVVVLVDAASAGPFGQALLDLVRVASRAPVAFRLTLTELAASFGASAAPDPLSSAYFGNQAVRDAVAGELVVVVANGSIGAFTWSAAAGSLSLHTCYAGRVSTPAREAFEARFSKLGTGAPLKDRLRAWLDRASASA